MKNYQIVTVENSNIRRWAREALASNWAKALLGSLLYMVLIGGPVFTFNFLFEEQVLSNISNIYTLLVGGPLVLGFITFIKGVFRKQDPSPMEVLYGFEKLPKAIGLMVVTNALVALWTMLFVIPGIIATCRYAMAFFILSDNPEIGIFDAIRESKEMMMGNKMKFFLLQLSFIGWVILSLITLGIGFVFLIPYMVAAMTGFYEVARGRLRPNFNELPDMPKDGVDF